MRRASTSPSIQLFPFLAVLVCAMGALILLLLVTTRKMRQAAVARAAAEAEAAEESSRPPPVPPALPPELPAPQVVPSGPSPEELAELQAARAARLQANALARKRQTVRQAEWQRSLVEAEVARDQRRQRVQQSEVELAELKQKLEVTETHLQRLADKKSKLKSTFDKDAKILAQAEKEHERLSAEIAAAQKALADLKRAHADAASKFAFIPYDGASGTTRRPIYIECSSTGIRFQPEGELLDESDLKGFTETFNPLLAASQNLMQYWREQAITNGDPKTVSRPYVLLLVRPKGTIAYYVARKMLGQLGDDFGYELIEEDFALQLPPADPAAKLTIQHAVAETLKNRGEMLAVGSRVGAPRLGEVLMGRNEELIEFGTLDDQVAASVAQEESPFAKNSGIQGKGFEVTRSPIAKKEVKPGSMRAALAERDRRRANGVPDSLADMVGRDGQPGGTNSGIGQPGGSRLAQNSGPGGPNNPQGSGLIDPFSREQLATGRTGAGSVSGQVSRDERMVGDANGDKAAGGGGAADPAGQPGSRPVSRLNNGIPRGAKAGKVIDIPTNAEPIASATGEAPDRMAGSNGTGTTGSPTGSRTSPPLSNMPPRGAVSGKFTDGEQTAAHGQFSAESTQNDPNTFAKAAPGSSTSSGNGSPSADPPTGRGNVGIISRSTDPQAAKDRIYGSNPEAQKQLAAAGGAKSTMQKRDAARRRWGGTNTGQIGFERKVKLAVMTDKIIVGDNDIEVIIEPGTKPDELVEAVLSALDEHSQNWGKPPTRFYWVPYINFDVYAGGSTAYQQLHAPLREWGIFSEAKFQAGDKPPVKEPNAIQPVSKTTTNPPDTKTPPKRVVPAETPTKKIEGGKPAAPSKSWFPWFQNSRPTKSTN